MTHKELITDIATATHLDKSQVAQLLDAAVQTIIEGLEDGQSVRLQNFGDLEVKKRNERLSVHPKTGVRTLVPPKLQLNFKQHNNLKDEIQTI